MLLFYIRHADPTYDPDGLTPLGERQAEALAKRLSLYGLDEIYSSTSNRAIMTAKPTSELVGKEIKLLDFANEAYAAERFTIEKGDGTTNKMWLFQNKKAINLFNDIEIKKLGDRWFEHKEFKKYDYGNGINKVYDEVDGFIKELGYEHERYSGKYKVIESNNKRIALFAHQGFFFAFLSVLLDIPYPMVCTHFDITPSGMTVIDFPEYDNYAVPKILTLSSDSHIYREGLPTAYKKCIYF